MPLEPELIALMLDEITLRPVTGKDKFNNFIFGDPITVKCQLVRMEKRVLDVTGREVVSSIGAILAQPEIQVGTNWELTLPDGSQPAIITVNAAQDETGPYYEEIRA